MTNLVTGSRKTNPLTEVNMGKIVINPEFTDNEDSEEALDQTDEAVEEADEADENDDEETTDESSEETDETDEEEADEDDEGEEEEGKPEESLAPAPTSKKSTKDTEPVAPTKIKIGDHEYDETELKDIVAKGTTVKTWEQKMPGFNLETLMPDYTQKSQRLAAYEKRTAPKTQLNEKELEELGVDEGQIKTFKAVAKHLGFVNQADMVQDSVEAQKEAFIASHPEYALGSPVNDAKWGKLMEEFNLFDWKSHPEKVTHFLEKAHSEASKSWVETERGTKTAEIIVTKQAKAKAVATGGSGGGTGAPRAQSSNTALADRYRAMGWSEEDIKEVLI